MDKTKVLWQRPVVRIGVAVVLLIILGGAAAGGYYLTQTPPQQPSPFLTAYTWGWVSSVFIVIGGNKPGRWPGFLPPTAAGAATSSIQQESPESG